jgi:hypothetical protein
MRGSPFGGSSTRAAGCCANPALLLEKYSVRPNRMSARIRSTGSRCLPRAFPWLVRPKPFASPTSLPMALTSKPGRWLLRAMQRRVSGDGSVAHSFSCGIERRSIISAASRRRISAEDGVVWSRVPAALRGALSARRDAPRLKSGATDPSALRAAFSPCRDLHIVIAACSGRS